MKNRFLSLTLVLTITLGLCAYDVCAGTSGTPEYHIDISSFEPITIEFEDYAGELGIEPFVFMDDAASGNALVAASYETRNPSVTFNLDVLAAGEYDIEIVMMGLHQYDGYGLTSLYCNNNLLTRNRYDFSYDKTFDSSFYRDDISPKGRELRRYVFNSQTLNQGINPLYVNVSKNSQGGYDYKLDYIKITPNKKTILKESEKAEFISEINSAHNAFTIKRLIESRYLWRFPVELSDYFYPERICAKLVNKDFSSYEEFIDCFEFAVNYESMTPTISLFCGNENVNMISPSYNPYSVRLSPSVSSDIIAVAATYKDDNMITADVKNLSTTEETVLNLGAISERDVITKIILLENLDSLKPLSPEKVFADRSIELFVSSTGDDTSSGNKNSPFATIKRAKEYARELIGYEICDININIAPGEYRLSEPLMFTEDDGQESYVVRYRAEDVTDKPVITGGTKVTGWTKVQDKPYYKATVDGVTEVRQLYVNGYPMHRAKSDDLFVAQDAYTAEDSSHSQDGFYLSGFDLPEFSNPEDLELVSHITWAHQRLAVKNVIKQNDDRTLFVMDQPAYSTYINLNCQGGIQPARGSMFYIENAIEYLDEPGEFCFDSVNKEVLYYPFDGDDINTSDMYIPLTEGLIEIKGSSIDSKVSGISFENIEFKHSSDNNASQNGWCTFQSDCVIRHDVGSQATSGNCITPNGAVEIEYADNISIIGCSFSNFGSAGIVMADAVSDSVITGNVINDISGTGIIVGRTNYSGEESQDILTSNILINNNIIRRIGQEYMSSPAIGVYYAKDIDIINNDISDTPYTAITVGWGWGDSVLLNLNGGSHQIKNNRINANSRIMYDGGAIYMLGYQGNTVISGNHITDSPDFAAIYLDSGSSDMIIENNVLEDFHLGFRGNPINTIVRNNYVDKDSHLLTASADRNSSLTNTIVVSDALWSGEALSIINGAGVEDEYKNVIACEERPPLYSTVYNIVPKSEQLSEDDILVEAEDYIENNGKPIIYGSTTRRCVGNLSTSTYLGYEFIAPQSGTYRIEIRYCAKYVQSDNKKKIANFTFKKGKYSTGQRVATVSSVLPSTDVRMNAYPSYTVGNITLTKGQLYSLHMQCGDIGDGGWSFDNIKLIYTGQ